MAPDDRLDARFRAAYEKLFPLIYRIAARITGESDKAEDLAHEAFLRLYQRGQALPDEDQTRYWLIRVVKNLSLNHEKRLMRERKAVERLRRTAPRSGPSTEDLYLRETDEGLIRELLAELPIGLRMPLVLKEYEGLTYREIGRILGITEGNVKVRIFRGREKLARLLEKRSES
jgi:RNA polymerase sigma-70 factor (ECF subfamily)